MANITVDAALQFVPFVGDIAAAFYKSNARNCAIFEKYLIAKGSKLTGGSSHPTEDEYELAPHPTHKSTRYANGGFEMSGSSTARPLAQAL